MLKTNIPVDGCMYADVDADQLQSKVNLGGSKKQYLTMYTKMADTKVHKNEVNLML
jgi:hypothetical protein